MSELGKGSGILASYLTVFDLSKGIVFYVELMVWLFCVGFASLSILMSLCLAVTVILML